MLTDKMREEITEPFIREFTSLVLKIRETFKDDLYYEVMDTIICEAQQMKSWR